MVAAQLAIRTAEVYTCAFAFDGARALTGAQGDSVRLWDTATGGCLRVCCAGISRSG